MIENINIVNNRSINKSSKFKDIDLEDSAKY